MHTDITYPADHTSLISFIYSAVWPIFHYRITWQYSLMHYIKLVIKGFKGGNRSFRRSRWTIPFDPPQSLFWVAEVADYRHATNLDKWSLWWRAYGKSNWVCGAWNIGFLITTMHPITELFKNQHGTTSASTLFARLSTCRLSFLPQDKNATQRLAF